MCCCFWVFFLSISHSDISTKSQKTIELPANCNYSGSKEIIIKFGYIANVCFLVFIFMFRGVASNIWFSHIHISNVNLSILTLILIVFLPLYKVLLLNLHIFKNMQIDYCITLILLNIVLPLIFFTSNILSFYFILELVANLILYQFIVGKDWEALNTNNTKKLFFNTNNTLKASYINILFFQYWVSFFSSVLLVYSMLTLLYNYGTTEWVLLNYLFNNSAEYLNVKIGYALLMLAFILKLGIAPIHFYKLEVYKSLPFISILFYTFYFFLVFFLFFSLLINTHLSQISLLWYDMLTILLVLGFLSLTFLIFDISSIKSFFAYSTIANTVGFCCLLTALL